MEELRKILTEMEMSSYKIETYLSLLKIKKGTIQQIAKVSKVPACKLYENLKWLYEHGYISLSLEKPLTYQANDPKVILESDINEKEEKLERIKKEIGKLNLIFPQIENDLVEITSSKEAFIKKMKESVIKSKKSISYTTENWSADSELWRLLSEKAKKGVKIRAIGPIDKKTKERAEKIKQAGVKIKPHNLESTRFSIYDKELAIIRIRKDESYSSIWIKSEVLAEILENYFNMLWNSPQKNNS